MQHLDEGTIHAWLDGELSSEQASEIEAHVADCPECAAMVAEARGLVAASTRILNALDDVPGGVIPAVPDIAPALPVRRRWYQRTDLRAAAAFLFVAGATLVVARRETDSVASRAMIATVDKGQPAPVTGAEKAAEGSAPAAQEAMSDAVTTSPVAAAPKAPEPAVSKPLAMNAPSRRAVSKSGVPSEADQLRQPKAMLDVTSSRLQARDEAKLSKEEFGKARGADAVVKGQVTEKQSGRVVADASVAVQGTTLGATTDKDGNFRIENIPVGEHSLLVRKIGYEAETVPLAVEEKKTAAAKVELRESPTALSEVVVTSAAPAPAVTATLGAAVNRIAPAQPLKMVRADSAGVTKRTIYEVSKGVEVTLTESPAEPIAERENADDAAARQKAAAPQSSAAPADARQREGLLGARASGVVAGMSVPNTAVNSISWTDRGRKYVLTGRLTTKDLEALKARLMQMRR